MKFDEFGRELPDPTPMAAPIGFKPRPSLIDQIRTMVRRELSQRAAADGFETFDEANDFDIGDDVPMPKSRHELDPDQEEEFQEWLASKRAAATGSEPGSGAPAAPTPVPPAAVQPPGTPGA